MKRWRWGNQVTRHTRKCAFSGDYKCQTGGNCIFPPVPAAMLERAAKAGVETCQAITQSFSPHPSVHRCTHVRHLAGAAPTPLPGDGDVQGHLVKLCYTIGVRKMDEAGK